MALVLIILLPIIAFVALSLVLVSVLGVALPWVAAQSWGAWALSSQPASQRMIGRGFFSATLCKPQLS